jgi:putative ABC transport system substrate-binding protein
MRRREFIGGLGSAAAWPAAVRGQQPAVPVVGYLNTGSRAASSSLEVAFRGGLGSMGFVEGRNVAIDYRYTEYQNDRSRCWPPNSSAAP